MQTACVRIRLKPGSLERVREWATELSRRPDEVLTTLREERVWVESVFLERTADGDFLVYYMRADDLDAAREVAKRSPHPIDAYHAQFKQEAWESSEQLELLIDFENPAS